MIIDINTIPTFPGIYIFKNGKNQVLYIGKAKNLKKRIAQYFVQGSVWKQDMIQKAQKVEFVFVDNEEESLLLENNMIKKYKPPYNSLLKGDNSYTYIKITNDKYPQIVFTRYKNNDGSYYIGPKTNKLQLKKMVVYLNSILKFRLCNNTEFNRGKLCSRYDFGLCKGWCVCEKKQSSNTKILNCETASSEYEQIINLIIDFFRGDYDLIKNLIKTQIDDCITNENYEWAANLRDVYLNIENITGKQSIELDLFVDGVSVLIKEIGNYRVFVILNIFKGKIIDIIRYKHNTNDITIDSLQLIIENEYGKIKYFKGFNNEYFGYSKDLKKLNEEYKFKINSMLENSLESYVVSTSFESENLMSELLTILKDRYKLKNFPYRIECVDISHISGSRVSAGVSCTIGGLTNNKFYRKYKINMDEKLIKNDDYLAMKEIIIRRFGLNKKSNNDLDFPDLFILDGGKGQLGIVKQILQEYPDFRQIYNKVDFVSLGKGKARKKGGKDSEFKEKIYYYDENFNIQEIVLNYDNADRVITKARDEAHRFSNYYRKQQMSKEFK